MKTVDTYPSSDSNNDKKYNVYFEVEVGQKTFYINTKGDKFIPKKFN